ncbi:superfamily II DNA or RNA helicase/HKD family nuclease [Weissella beninensis]|uniref:DEAD/DEAH box helicase n=1 Tax=Periweissella beninensis TaxID=504936 RepID=A0ABT0VGX1_9LACO|nr:DEAD/DEAH box helicase [Periweissella beninensis]MBM7543766.1 superfamily II DNA or RNA helicase/HKD family nuclease [Periweissella beninensis]MCM2436850.1 DEAD/DEAH box helicase [Periweissella beninensis]
MVNSSEEIVKVNQFAYINNENINVDELASELQPQLVTNKDSETVLEYLLQELKTADTFMFAVAFITESGLIGLKSTFADLAKRGIRGRLITSNYLQFNNPKVYRELLKIKNIDVKIANIDGFHTKTYIFEHVDYISVIVGSSNLTQNALKKNVEWNLKVTSLKQGDITQQIKNNFEELWDQAAILTTLWIDNYQRQFIQNTTDRGMLSTNNIDISKLIVPNKMQNIALKELKNARKHNAKKGLIVAATGTGKTYLAAMDVKQVNAKRLLFVVHREGILKKSLMSFKRVLGGNEEDYGLISGTSRANSNAKYIFATINMASKEDFKHTYTPDFFDYIIIDEAHRIGHGQNGSLTMYEKILSYFKPQFLLGMTATPRRTDGMNVYEYFDYNVVYEISLSDALAVELLTPFHYIGVTDFEHNGTIIDDNTQLKYLVSQERVDYLIEKTDYYGFAGEQLKGLIFVSRIKEAESLSQELNRRGYKTTTVSGTDNQEIRESKIKKLEVGEFDYLITVDVFNEGIDIPCINQVVLMRPTQSSIIFLQQLGRGLRKYKNKEYVTVIDFIGNYKNNYMIPMAFDKARQADKEKIVKNIISPKMEGVSTINFEEIAVEKILNSVKNIKFDSKIVFKEAYLDIKQKNGNNIPFLMDFLKFGTINITDIFSIKKLKFKNLLDYQKYADDDESINWPNFNAQERQYLNFIYNEILCSKRITEVFTLYNLIFKEDIKTSAQLLKTFKENSYYYDKETLSSIQRVLTFDYFLPTTLKNNDCGSIGIVTVNQNNWFLKPEFISCLDNKVFVQYVKDALITGMQYLQNIYRNDQLLTINEKYLRKDVIRILNWEKEQNAQNVGGYIMRKNKRFLPMFVTLKKGNVKNLVAYEDHFTSRDTMIWYSKSKRNLDSPTEKVIAHTDEYGFIQVFVKKSDEITKDGNSFYYLGSAKVTAATLATHKNKDNKDINLIKFEIKLQKPVDYDLYTALTIDI